MCDKIDKMRVIAHLRGEGDLADVLKDFELSRSNEPAHINNLNENLKHGYDNLERRLRGTH